MKYKNSNGHDHQQVVKLGVLVTNLGTPSEPTPSAVRKYLKQFLSDTRVVEIPRIIWWMILNLIILPFRAKRSAHAYQSIWTPEGSPLMVNTANIAKKLNQRVQTTHNNIQVDFAMRYGEPSIENQLNGLIKSGTKKLLVLPLYPQYSATTTGSTFDAVAETFRKRRWFPDLRFVNQYHDDPLYIQALANKVKRHWQKHGQAQRLVLSFHGIPKQFWQNGDPYVCHCFKTARLLIEALELDEQQVLTCFQSRFGKAEWVQPYLDATLKSLPAQGVESVQVICPGFSADCLETLEEISEENKAYFEEAGGQKFEYIACLNDDDEHIEFLASLVERHTAGWQTESVPAEQLKSLVENKKRALEETSI